MLYIVDNLRYLLAGSVVIGIWLTIQEMIGRKRDRHTLGIVLVL